MKKLKSDQLKFDKEVITSLSESELSYVKGGGNVLSDGSKCGCWGGLPKTVIGNTCVSACVTVCQYPPSYEHVDGPYTKQERCTESGQV